jgi:large-conductance mechanosensitive channel
MTVNMLATMLWRIPSVVAQAGVPGSAQDVPDQGWGGLLGVVVVFLAICLTIMLMRTLSRKARDGSETESEAEAQNSKADEEAASVTRRAH